MDCKRALESTGGDMEKAIDYLRKKGAAVGAKRADRAAKEGTIVTRVSTDGKSGVIVEVNCETDFVGRSEDFLKFAGIVAAVVQQHKPATVGQLAGMHAEGKTIAELQNDILAKVGEKIDIRRFQVVDSSDGAVTAYTHVGGKIGVLVELVGIPGTEATTGVGRDLAMQIAAMNPSVVNRDQVDKSAIEREKEVYRTQAKNEGKPDHILEKIVTGRLEKFFQEICLVEQTFIKDGTKTVKDILHEASAKTGKTVAVKRFYRFHLGEEAK